MAMKLGIQAGDVVLDVGCGVGGPAREIAIYADCNVVGINNNDYQYPPRLHRSNTAESQEPPPTQPNAIFQIKSLSSKEIS